MIQQDPEFYVSGVISGDRRALSKTITLIESSHPEHRRIAGTVIDRLLPNSGNAVRLGITGVPGVGKSTFIESLGLHLVQENLNIAVLAVDPSSRRSGGSILGDKTRMEKLSVEPRAFIRPSPSGGTLGGVASKTREAMIVCEAAGFDVILVETVGVGQSETAVASMVDFFLVLMLAGAGDELQGIKKGIMELADAVVINKADGDNKKKAELSRTDYETALHYFSSQDSVWSPVVRTCSAIEGTGISEIWETVLEHKRQLIKSGTLEAKRKHQVLSWMWEMIDEELKTRFYEHPEIKVGLPLLRVEVENGTTSPGSAVRKLFSKLS